MDLDSHFNKGGQSHLPTADFLNEHILPNESQRPVPENKETLNQIDFTPIREFLSRVDIKSTIFDTNIKPEEVLTEGEAIIDKVSSLIMKDAVSYKLELDSLYNYLSKQDEPIKSDIIFVFGGKTISRVTKAVDLYKDGFAPYILFTGNHPSYNQEGNDIPEAVADREMAIQMGVSEGNIIIEGTSITVPDNVRSALNVLDKTDIKHEDYLVVTVPYLMRRGSATLNKYIDNGKITRVCCDSKYNASNWYLDGNGIKLIFNEYIKMRVAQLLDSI
jgi:uncharacterized SAM-binding protein YcdF (DUF218 family)